VISKYVKINPEDIKVHLERQDNLEVLEVKIELPEVAAMSLSSGLSASTRPLRAMAISSLPASMAACFTISRSAGVQLFQTSLLTTKISGSAT
jgi:hypothetical protein